jgi:hypothetical protein
VHPNGTTKSHPPPSIVKALTPSQLADTPSSPLPHNHAHLGRAHKAAETKNSALADRKRGVPPVMTRNEWKLSVIGGAKYHKEPDPPRDP